MSPPIQRDRHSVGHVGQTLMNDERRAYDQRPQHDDHQHYPRPGGERQHQQRGQDHPPARDGGQQRSTRPGRAAARPGAENRQHHLRGVVPFQHHQQGNHERQNQPPCPPRSGRILIFSLFPHYLLDKPSEKAAS